MDDGGSEGGDPVCWLALVCEECGRMRGRPLPAPCESCGFVPGPEAPDGGRENAGR